MIHGFNPQVFPFHNRLIAKIAFLSLNIAKLILGGVKQHARFFSAKLQLAKCCALTSILRTSTFFTCLRLFSFPPRGGPKIKQKLPCDDFPAGVKIFAGCGLLGFCTTLIPWKFEVIFGKMAKFEEKSRKFENRRKSASVRATRKNNLKFPGLGLCKTLTNHRQRKF